MSDHQETLAQVVKRIEVSFDKIKQYSEKTISTAFRPASSSSNSRPASRPAKPVKV